MAHITTLEECEKFVSESQTEVIIDTKQLMAYEMSYEIARCFHFCDIGLTTEGFMYICNYQKQPILV